MAGNLEIKNAQGKKVTLQNPDTNGSDIVVDLADNASKTYVTSVNKKRRNYLINGNFQFWDYASSQTTAGYGSDNRWKNSHAGSTKTHSRITSGDTERALFESPYYSRTVASSVVGANNFVTKSQVIEDITKLNLNVILLILQDSILFSWQYTKAILKFLPKEYIFCNTNRIIYIHKENKKKENGNFEESWKNFKKKRKIN